MEKKKNKFYKTVFIFVLPMVIQNLINVAVVSLDVVMLGKLNKTVLAAASLASQWEFILTLTLFGIGSGATILTSQYWGKGDKKTIEKILGYSMRIALTASFFFFIMAFFFPNVIMNFFSSESDVIYEGIKYLKIVSFAYMLTAITMTYLNIMRSVEKIYISTYVYITSFLVNGIVNYLLIFGNFGFPKLGIVGAAIGTLIARSIEVCYVCFFSYKYRNLIGFSVKNLINTDKILKKDFFKYSSPVIVNELIWAAGISATVAILGNLDSDAVAANSIAQVVRRLFMVVNFGFSNAAAIMLGKVIGENKFKLALAYANKFIKLALSVGVISSLTLFILRPFIVSQFSLTPKVGDLLSFMLLLMCVYMLMQAINVLTIVGIFRAGGDSKIGLYIDFISSWGSSIIIAFLAAFVFKLPVKIVYICLLLDELFKLPFVIWRFKSKKWIKNVTQDF